MALHDLALAPHHQAQVLDSLLLRHEVLWVSLGTYVAWMRRGVNTQWSETSTIGRQSPTEKSFL